MSSVRPGQQVPLKTPRQRRLHGRVGKRLLLGALIGTVVGATIGAVVGAIWFQRAGAIVTSALAGAIFGVGVAMLISGYSSLESPDPGKEPSDTQRPIADRPEPVREEYEEESS